MIATPLRITAAEAARERWQFCWTCDAVGFVQLYPPVTHGQ